MEARILAKVEAERYASADEVVALALDCFEDEIGEWETSDAVRTAVEEGLESAKNGAGIVFHTDEEFRDFFKSL